MQIELSPELIIAIEAVLLLLVAFVMFSYNRDRQ